MKNLAPLLFLLVISQKLLSTNYYLSTTGNDLNSGTSSASPWQTIAHLNLQTLSPGDSVLFKCGDTFRGRIIANQTGNSASRIVYSSYGSGNKPIISGAEQISTWTFNGTYYQATYATSVVNFFVNGIEQTLARYPNNHQYLTYDSTSTTYLKDASLGSISATLVNGSKICIHDTQWSWEKADVTAFASPKITFGTNMLPSTFTGFGYFLYNNINHLDTCGEWFYNSAATQISYMPSVGLDPNNLFCEGSVYTNGIQFGPNVSYISISGIDFQKQSNAGIQIGSGTNRYVVIDNCNFENQYNHGINDKGKYNVISNSYFREVDGIAIYENGSAHAPTIDHNIFRNVGPERNYGIGGQINFSAITCANTDSAYVHHNDVDSVGYCGISVDGKYCLIERNIVDHPALLVNDAAGLKSWGVGTQYTTWRNNFTSNGDGCLEGTNNAQFLTPGIYFDLNVNNCTITQNTVFNHAKKGIFVNSGCYNNTVTSNVVYGGDYCIDLNGSAITGVPITGMTIKHNEFVVRDNNGYCLRQVDYQNNFNAGTIDSNYFFNPYVSNHAAFRYVGNSPTSYNFSNWQGTGNDLHSVPNWMTWAYPIDSTQLFMNATDNISTISLGNYEYKDLDGNPICGSLTLQPYTSQVLIQTNIVCTTGITETKSLGEISVYPNPASDEINIFLPNFKDDVPFVLMDETGRNILIGVFTNENATVNLNEYASGIYFLRTFGNTPSTKEIVKK